MSEELSDWADSANICENCCLPDKMAIMQTTLDDAYQENLKLKETLSVIYGLCVNYDNFMTVDWMKVVEDVKKIASEAK